MAELKITELENRAILMLAGRDVWNFLQNLITNDMKMVSDSKCIYSALLTAQGKFLHDFFVVKSGDTYLLECAADRKDDLIRRLTLYKLRADVTISEGTQKIFALFGEGTDEAVNLPATEGSVAEHDGSLYLTDPRNASLGARIIASPTFDPATAFPTAASADEEAYDAHRLRLGVPEGGRDILPEKNFLLEANFEELNGVSFAKGCYVGQELTARTKHRAKIKKRLFRITYDGELHSGDKITQGGREIADVRSFTNGQGLALVRLENIANGMEDMEPRGVQLIQPDYIDLPIMESQ